MGRKGSGRDDVIIAGGETREAENWSRRNEGMKHNVLKAVGLWLPWISGSCRRTAVY